MTLLSGFHHTTAFSKSLAENLSFYESTLGLKLVLNTVHQENLQIRHLFYGDELASPGSLLSFFILPRAGRSYKKENYFKNIHLGIPKGSLTYWFKRLEAAEAKPNLHESNSQLYFSDPDGLAFVMEEIDDLLPLNNQVKHSSVPAKYQIIRVIGATLSISGPFEERNFLMKWLEFTDSFPEEVVKTSKQTTLYIPHLDSLSNKGNTIELLLNLPYEKGRSRVGKGFVDHLAFSVGSYEDLVTLKTRAEALNLEIEMFVDRGFFSSLYVKSPHGLRYEIATKEPGIKMLEDTRQLIIPTHMKAKEKEIIQNLGGRLDD